AECRLLRSYLLSTLLCHQASTTAALECSRQSRQKFLFPPQQLLRSARRVGRKYAAVLPIQRQSPLFCKEYFAEKWLLPPSVMRSLSQLSLLFFYSYWLTTHASALCRLGVAISHRFFGLCIRQCTSYPQVIPRKCTGYPKLYKANMENLFRLKICAWH